MQETTESQKHKQGFSLVELLVVMAIIAILMGIVIGISGGVNRGAAEAQAKAQVSELVLELEKYRGDEGQFPANWDEFRDWYLYTYSGTAYTITDGTLRADETFSPLDPWGKPYRYTRISDYVMRVSSDGPDGTPNTEDDINNLKGSI